MKVVAIYRASCSSKARFPLYMCPVPAGSPSSVEDYIEDEIDLKDFIKHPDKTFLLHVAGDSMINAGINHGDMLMVEQTTELMELDIAIAVVNGDLTVKQLKWENNGIVLLAANPNYKPLRVSPDDDFHVWGVVIRVVRDLPRGTKLLGQP